MITLPVQELEKLDVFDPNRYNKNYLLNMIKKFLEDHDYLTFQNLIKKLTKTNYIQNFPFMYEI